MKVVYVAGPYRSETIWGVRQNILAAEARALDLWRAGWAVICPHKNTAFFDGAASDDVWLKGDMEILRRCDAISLLPNWRRSKGAFAEAMEARRLKLLFVDERGEHLPEGAYTRRSPVARKIKVD